MSKTSESSSPKAKANKAEVTTETPKDPAWDGVRQTWSGLANLGRMMLRGQVLLGIQLAALKKTHGVHAGQPKKNSAESAEYLPWDKIVEREIPGLSRRSADVFIKLAEAAKLKLAKSKALALPAAAKKDTLAIFQTENPLSLSEEQWGKVAEIVGTLTTGETQASLMQELGVIAKPKAMPTGQKDPDTKGDEPTAGELAFHFFSTLAAPLTNLRSNPDYKAMLAALPFESSEDQPLSLCTLEADLRAALADVEEVKTSTAKQAKGRAL